MSFAPKRAEVMICRPDEHRHRISSMKSWGDVLETARHYESKCGARALDLAEAMFWLGGVCAGAQRFKATLSPNDVVGMIVDETGEGRDLIKDSYDFYSVFMGDFDAMRQWALGCIKAKGTIFKADVTRLSGANKKRVELSKIVESVEGGETALGIRPSGSRAAVDRKFPLRPVIKRDRVSPIDPLRQSVRGLAKRISCPDEIEEWTDTVSVDGNVFTVTITVAREIRVAA